MKIEQVQAITPAGITYLDNEGLSKFIDFAEWFQTNLEQALSAPIMTELMAKYVKQLKQVGEINYLGDIDGPAQDGSFIFSAPYALFYDSQNTLFEFADQQECAAFHQRVTDVGWYLFDLSD